MDESLIVCDNLVKIYKIANLEVVALQGLDLAVKRGELLGIVGASGSGKSTLMNILGGLDRPSAGRVWVDRHDLLKMSDAALDRYRRTKVGFVWQQGARNLIPYLNALENVKLPMTLAGITGRARSAAAPRSCSSSVGLAERRHHLSAADVGRRAAARGDRRRPGQQPSPAAGRRADRRGGLDDRPDDLHRPSGS